MRFRQFVVSDSSVYILFLFVDYLRLADLHVRRVIYFLEIMLTVVISGLNGLIEFFHL